MSASTLIASPRPALSVTGRRRLAVHLAQALVIGALLGAWQLLVALGVLQAAFVSEPSQLLPAFWDGVIHGTLLGPMGTTLYETFAGFGLSVALGLLAGYLLSEYPFVNAVFRPFLTGFNSLPRIALAPLFVLWFGLGSFSRIVLIISLSFFIVASTRTLACRMSTVTTSCSRERSAPPAASDS